MIKLNNGRIVLLNGDCLHEMRRIKPNSIDMVFADLPYGQTQNNWDSPIDLTILWSRYLTIGKTRAPYVFTAQTPFDKVLGCSNLGMLKYDWIWIKSTAVNFLNVKRQPLRKHEHILTFYKQQCIYNPQMIKGKEHHGGGGRKTTNLNYNDIALDPYRSSEWYHPNSILYFPISQWDKGIHPTQKPIELLEYLIKTYTNPGDTVLDPTMGSGTTGVACANLNRKFIGIEKDENYFNIAARRIAQSVRDHEQVVA